VCVYIYIYKNKYVCDYGRQVNYLCPNNMEEGSTTLILEVRN